MIRIRNNNFINSGKNYFLKFNSIKRSTKSILKIKEIKKYLSFLFKNNKIYGSCITKDNSLYDYIPYKYKISIDDRINKFAPSEEGIKSNPQFSSLLYQRILESRYNELENINNLSL